MRLLGSALAAYADRPGLDKQSGRGLTCKYLYPSQQQAYITRLDKATFTITGVLRLGSNAIYVQSASIDMAAQTAYFGTYQSPASQCHFIC